MIGLFSCTILFFEKLGTSSNWQGWQRYLIKIIRYRYRSFSPKATQNVTSCYFFLIFFLLEANKNIIAFFIGKSQHIKAVVHYSNLNVKMKYLN